MTVRGIFLLGVIVAALSTFVGWPVTAQQPTRTTTSTGFAVEEVRVGGSCVVVVSKGGGGPNVVAAVPCR